MTDADMIEAMARAIGPSFIGNRMPDMSGDPLRKATPYERRRIDEAVVAALAVVRPEIDRLRAERDKAREYGAQARIRENEERAKFEEMRGRAEVAETHSAALARALAEARDELLECKADYHRNPSSVIDKCNAVLAEARSLLAPKEDTDA